MAPNGNASHSQIWDDSSLVDSWNEALEEYKVRTRPIEAMPELTEMQKYHSIKARGENVENVLKDPGNTSNQMSVKQEDSKPDKFSHWSRGGEDVHYEENEVNDHHAQDPRAKKEPAEETADLDITTHEENVPVSSFVAE